MKILYSSQIKEADQYTIKNEPISSFDLMQRAAREASDWLLTEATVDIYEQKLTFFCGTGNNGGDGLLMAANLSYISHIQVYIVKNTDKRTEDFELALEQLKNVSKAEHRKSISIAEINKEQDIPTISANDVCIDAIFGIGISKPITGLVAKVIETINHSSAQVIAIDMPSGLFAERNDLAMQQHIIKATCTLTFEQPKISFFFEENQQFLGKVYTLPIGLHPDFLDKTEAHFFTIDRKTIDKIYRKRQKIGHKGTFGHALLMVGSYGKMGAAVLAAQGCMRSGAGLLTVHTPRCGYDILQMSIPEALVQADESQTKLTQLQEITDYKAIGVGCGIGTDEMTKKLFLQLLDKSEKPLVIDADALNILAQHKSYLFNIPKNSILTPHPKEFERMFGETKNPFDRTILLQHIARKFKLCVILKGTHTIVALPDNTCWINTIGNSGMATAGSGDVLTGILTGLLAQGYEPAKACLLGVYLHSLAGDLAAEDLSKEAMLAGDIAKYIGKAFLKLNNGE
jgi:ADP-dependent NAD(P)H-hydrate dehydratase / NAD(P)H-hydrate epimerase